MNAERPLHIAVICRALGTPGSVAAVALRQARELTRHARVTLVSDSFPDAVDWAERVRLPVRYAGFLRRFRHVPDELLFARAARRALRSMPAPDFVLCHSHAVAYLAARPAGVPFGFFVHGDISDRPPGTYDARLTAFYRWVTPRAYRTASIVFVLAPLFAGIAERAGAKNVQIIPNGIDPADIGDSPSAPRTRREGEPLRILYVGRLAVEKGVANLLDACALLQVDHRLTIVGGGPLESMVRKRLTDRWTMTGIVPRSSLGAIYAEHDVACFPPLSETFASVITEALVSGLPVVATRVGGIPAVVNDGVNGILVPPSDPAALAAALTTLATDEPLRRKLATAARGSVLPRLAWTSIGDQIAHAIRAVTT